MNIFSFKYSKSILILIPLIILLAAGGLAWNIYSLIYFIGKDSFNAAIHAVACGLALFLLVFALSVIIYGKYKVTSEYLYCYFGFIRTKSKVSEIMKVTHFRKSDKLVIYFKDAKYSVVVIAPEYYGAFIEAVRRINPAAISEIDDELTDGKINA